MWQESLRQVLEEKLEAVRKVSELEVRRFTLLYIVTQTQQFWCIIAR